MRRRKRKPREWCGRIVGAQRRLRASPFSAPRGPDSGGWSWGTEDEGFSRSAAFSFSSN